MIAGIINLLSTVYSAKDETRNLVYYWVLSLILCGTCCTCTVQYMHVGIRLERLEQYARISYFLLCLFFFKLQTNNQHTQRNAHLFRPMIMMSLPNESPDIMMIAANLPRGDLGKTISKEEEEYRGNLHYFFSRDKEREREMLTGRPPDSDWWWFFPGERGRNYARAGGKGWIVHLLMHWFVAVVQTLVVLA